VAIAISLSAMCTQAQQCYLYDTTCGDGKARYNHTGAEERFTERGGFGKAAKNSPGVQFCCKLDSVGFIGIYENYGQYALSFYSAVITFTFTQICFIIAACGCAQRWSDNAKWRCERSGHLVLFFAGLIAFMPLVYCATYISDNGLWLTCFLNFCLTKGASFVGALCCLSAIWYVLYSWQSRDEREGRMGNDIMLPFYIQWDDPDVLEYWRENPSSVHLQNSSAIFALEHVKNGDSQEPDEVKAKGTGAPIAGSVPSVILQTD